MDKYHHLVPSAIETQKTSNKSLHINNKNFYINGQWKYHGSNLNLYHRFKNVLF